MYYDIYLETEQITITLIWNNKNKYILTILNILKISNIQTFLMFKSFKQGENILIEKVQVWPTVLC